MNEIKKRPKKRRKNIQRICDSCLEIFYASRSDAKYCSHSCRQKVYKTGESFGYNTNPAEHFLVHVLEIFLSTFIAKNGNYLFKEQLILWINQCNLIETLFFDYLDDDNHYKSMLIDIIDEFFNMLLEKFEEEKSMAIRLTIPEDYLDSWNEFLEAYD